MKRTGWAAAIASVIAGYGAVYLIVRPLADAPVVDGWIYSHAVRLFAATGRLRFVGFTEAMPVAQVFYGAAWARLFGASEASLDLSVASLGAIGAILFYALLIRCGVGRAEAAIATGLLAANPCYLFLSFSFMSDVPFLVLIVAATLAFAKAEPPSGTFWLWVCALLSVAAFMIRPFAAAAIAGFAGATLFYELRPNKLDRRWLKFAARRLMPCAATLVACAGIWIWLMAMQAQPFRLERRTHLIGYFFTVSLATYLRAGVLGPLLYLGIVLSPLAMFQLVSAGLRRATAIGIAAGIFIAACILIRLDPIPPATPELSCFGGWSNALLLQGLPNHFEWRGAGQWLALALGSVGASGLIVAASRAWPRLNRAGAALTIAAACYWAGTIPLWLFNDRYYLFLVPAAAMLLAMTPIRSPRLAVVAVAMTAAMGFFSVAGVYDYQRGFAAVIAARDTLVREGVARSEIDAGYSLNGEDLYRFADDSQTQDSLEREQGIPMITSSALDAYTIAAAPIAGTAIVRRLDWPSVCGFGRRDLYVLRRADVPSPPDKSPVK